MKNAIALFLILFLSCKSFGQTDSRQIKIDELVSVNLPGNVEIFDTIIEKLKLFRFQSTNGTQYFGVIKMEIDSIKNQPYDFPYDLKSLEDAYHNLMADFIEQFSVIGLVVRDSTSVKFDQFIGYQIRFKDPESGKPNGQSLILMLDKNVYTLFYMDKINFNETVKNDFFNSLTIDKQWHPKQMTGTSGSVKIAGKLGALAGIVLIIVLFIYLIRKSKKKNTLYQP
ncbi:MAG: hypothetical protein WCI71_04510 [Bacteroidota bacterium]